MSGPTEALAQALHTVECPNSPPGAPHWDDATAILDALPEDSAMVTVETLTAAMREAWPKHAERQLGTGTAPTIDWWVRDPALPSEGLAAAIIEALRHG